MTFRRRVGVLFLIISFGSYIAALTLLVVRSIEEQYRAELEITENAQVELKRSVTRSLEEIKRLLSIHIIDDDLKYIIYRDREVENGEKYLNNLNYINNVVRLASSLNPNILGVTFITLNRYVYTNTDHTDEDMEVYFGWIDRLDSSGSNILYSGVYHGKFFQNERKILTIVHRMEDLFLGTIGHIVIDVDFRMLTEIVNESLREGTVIEIIQGEEVIYSSSAAPSQQATEYIVLSDTYSLLNWKIKHYVHKYNIYRKSLSVAYIYFASILPISLITGLVLFFSTSKLVSPITALSRHMAEMRDHTYEEGNVLPVPRNADHEIDVLYRSFNEYIVRLRESIMSEYAARVYQKHIELLMLQSQINPHFLYNTLNLISSIAELNDIEEIPEICGELSDILRYSLCSELDVLLEEEIEIVEKYVNISTARYPGKFILQTDVPIELRELFVQRFMLQPIVENATKHGMRAGKQKMVISIIAKKQDDVLELWVQDNGLGIDDDRLVAIRESLEDHYTFDRRIGLGIRNVHYRIQDRYGEDYGLSVDSKNGEWTSVTMRIPVRKVGESSDDEIDTKSRRGV